MKGRPARVGLFCNRATAEAWALEQKAKRKKAAEMRRSTQTEREKDQEDDTEDDFGETDPSQI